MNEVTSRNSEDTADSQTASPLAQRIMESLRHSVAENPRERAEMNALLEATDQGNARLVHTMT